MIYTMLGGLLVVLLIIGAAYFRIYYVDYWITKPKMPYPVHVFSVNFKWRYYLTRLFHGRDITAYRTWLRAQRYSVPATDTLEKEKQDFHHFALNIKADSQGLFDPDIFLPTPQPLYSKKKLPAYSLPSNVDFRVFVPKTELESDKKLGIVFYAHGGGWSYNDIDCYCLVTANYSRFCSGKFIVVSMDYRKAPEFAFPTPNNDIMCAMYLFYSRIFALQQQPASNLTDELSKLATKLDLSKIACVGDSAGANMMLGINYYLKDLKNNKSFVGAESFYLNFDQKLRIEPSIVQKKFPYFNPKHLVILYPALHYPKANLQRYESYDTYKRYSYVIDTYNALDMWRDFGGIHDNSIESVEHEKNLMNNPYFSIISTLDNLLSKKDKNDVEGRKKVYAEFFANLPNLTIIGAEHDPLVDEGKEFAKIVKESGVLKSVTHHLFADTYHGFASLKVQQIGELMTREISESWN